MLAGRIAAETCGGCRAFGGFATEGKALEEALRLKTALLEDNVGPSDAVSASCVWVSVTWASAASLAPADLSVLVPYHAGPQLCGQAF